MRSRAAVPGPVDTTIAGPPGQQSPAERLLAIGDSLEHDVAGAAGAGTPGAAVEEDDGPGPFPRRYLFNKLFDSGAPPEGAAKTP